MLPRIHRLTSGREFVHTIRSGRRAGTRTIVTHLSVGEQTAPPRVGLVVGKAVGTAVVRNRVKRRLRHLASGRVGLLPGGDVLVIRALPAAGAADSTELGEDLDRALARLGVGTTG